MCSQFFNSMSELNKHAEEEHYSKSEDQRRGPASRTGLPDSPEMSGDGVDYDLGRPLDSDDLSTDESTNSNSEDDHNSDFKAIESDPSYVASDEDTNSSCNSEGDHKRDLRALQSDLNYAESDEDTNSSSTESGDSSYSPKRGQPTHNTNKDSVCKECGRGPFKSLKLHLRHCTSVTGVTFQCARCMMSFPNEAALKEHRTFLYSCDRCGQVFKHWDLHHHHPPPDTGALRLLFFCSESMPKACTICKCFFVNEKCLFAHVAEVHTSVVSTTVRIVTRKSGLTDNKMSSSVATLSAPVVNGEPVIDKLLLTDHTYSSSAKVEASFPAPACSDPQPAIPPTFDSQRQASASTKRANASRRSKAPPRPCRQCGTMLRQPYLAICHRYLHRGRRSHRCQCGRSFKHRLHLLRHCVQHAEAESYICVNCGKTFTGARLLAKHLGTRKKEKCRRKCMMPLACSCGHFFYRASAYIWHQLKNNVKTGHFKTAFNHKQKSKSVRNQKEVLCHTHTFVERAKTPHSF
ncbi:zinc finger protein 70 [Syngnathoides biaculeatus]|uniref:zinc finger protein 70 n=1 Tax=Syngnathoides biaculeatus TaxID=300417 RepID=UPI002ADDFFEC|nr:zinc finger protein 70 [Syngnathoides biaculeatus]XP_061675860.1 zinc finger protein 70 [Syngnathoides biaculeatus]